MIQPELKASWAPTRNRTAIPSATASERSGEKRRLAAGATRPSSTISATSSAPGTERSGSPRRAGVDRARLDLRPGHVVVARRRGGVEVLERRRRRADHHDLVAEQALLELAVQDPRERVALERVPRPVVVDPGGLAVEARRIDRLAGGHLGGGHGERLEPVDAERDAPQHPAGVVRKQAVAQPRVDVLEQLGHPEERPLAALVDLGGGEHGLAVGGEDALEQRDVVRLPLGLARLAELDVVGDRARLLGGQPPEQLRVHVAPERPAQVELLERHVVDLHDHEVVGRALLTADREAGIHRVEVDVAQPVDRVEEHADGADDDAQGHEEGLAQPRAALTRPAPRSGVRCRTRPGCGSSGPPP